MHRFRNNRFLRKDKYDRTLETGFSAPEWSPVIASTTNNVA